MPENLSRNLPDAMVQALMQEKLIDQPNVIVDSIEASAALPAFSPDELRSAMRDFERIADEAHRRLEAMRAREAQGLPMAKRAGRDASGTKKARAKKRGLQIRPAEASS